MKKALLLLMLFSAFLIFLTSFAWGDQWWGFLYDNGNYKILKPPAWNSAQASKISNSGQIIGYGSYNSQMTYFVYSNGNYKILQPSPDFFLIDINNNGQVLGTGYNSNNSSWDNFLYSNGSYTFLPQQSFNWNGGYIQMLGAGAINDSGQVAGVCSYDNSISNNFDPVVVGCIYSNGDFTTLSTPPEWMSPRPTAINNSGQIAGITHPWSGHLGFLYSNGSSTILQPPGSRSVDVFDINDSGQVVGTANNGSNDFGFLYDSDGSYRTLLPPGWGSAIAYSINNSSQVVGQCWTEKQLYTGCPAGFLYSHGLYTILPVYSAMSINDTGQIVGQIRVPERPASLIDPVASGLLVGSSISTNQDTLAKQDKIVGGVAADGVARVIVRIPTTNTTASVTVSVINDQGTESDSVDENGGLFSLDNQSETPSSTLTLKPSSTSAGPMAFAIYVAPRNFSRGYQDDNLAQRNVLLHVTDSSTCGQLISIQIVRPPVVLVHGLWDSPDGWKTFSLPDCFPFVRRVDYSGRITGVEATDPEYILNVTVPTKINWEGQIEYRTYSINYATEVRGNSLGYAYNASNVLSQIRKAISEFGGKYHVAVAQADIVAHSMGGLVSRTMVLMDAFRNDKMFGAGPIHKLITIGTPHLGSQVATHLLQPENMYLRNVMAAGGSLALKTVTLNWCPVSPPLFPITEEGSKGVWTGAVENLQGDGINGSTALLRLTTYLEPFPTAYIGTYIDSANTDGLDKTLSMATAIRNADEKRATLSGTDPCPLAQSLTSTGWPLIFGGNDSDGIVSLNSQLKGGNRGIRFQGVIHSAGLTGLGFDPPYQLEGLPLENNETIPNTIKFLLNEPLNGPDFK